MKRKGQAAMEYLMTYGWALLVVVIVIAILIFLNPIQETPGCKFTNAGLACDQPNIPQLATNGTLYFTLTNGYKKSGLNAANITCIVDPTGANYSAATLTPTLIGPMSQLEARQFRLTCYDGAASTPTVETNSAGTYKKGMLIVRYKFDGDSPSAPVRQDIARFTVKVT